MIRVGFFFLGCLALFFATTSHAVCPTNPQCIVFQQQYIPGTITYSAYPLDINSCGEAILGSYVFNKPAGTWGNLTVKLFYWNGSSWINYAIYTPRTILENYNSVYAKLKALGTEVPFGQTISEVLPNGCPNPCSEKKDQVNYKLIQHNVGETYSAQNSCYDNCQQTTEVLWEDCINSSCVSSVKYTYTGQKCTDEPGLSDILPTPPTRCSDQLKDIITQCGGSLNVQSFNFETCTGSCTADSCQNEWNALVTRCGGFMGISSWDNQTCSGTCASDPMPQPPSGQEKPPVDIDQTETINQDGSKAVTRTSTYENQTDHYIYKNQTITYYDSSGVQTGQSSTTTRISGAGDSSGNTSSEPLVAPSGDMYTKKNDLSNGLASRVNYQQVIDAVHDFDNTFIVQGPNMLVSGLNLLRGSGCEYPPRIVIDFHNSLSSEPIVISFGPFASVANIMKFFFSLICLFMTIKMVINLFD